VGGPVNADDNDDVPRGTDPVCPDDTALQSEGNQLPAAERPNPFLRGRRAFLFQRRPRRPQPGATGVPTRLTLSASGSAVPASAPQPYRCR